MDLNGVQSIHITEASGSLFTKFFAKNSSNIYKCEIYISAIWGPDSPLFCTIYNNL